MKFRDVASALTRYDERRDPDDHRIDRILPAEPGTVHAVADGFPRVANEPHFLDGWERERALCGRSVNVLLPQKFDDEDPDACTHCARAAGERARDPEAWTRLERERAANDHRRWWRDYKAEQVDTQDDEGDGPTAGGDLAVEDTN